ncbi:translational activator of cytochrome c oxidase 1 isoform X1 [Athalia rosae]|uniref:translational activator of cytochrome c oxidase 1 isoform X1 n=1 Tax=Athalia rosae TaxID=37344 RepID=UPI00203439C4|nr:translational activator of cytochrome c oxidase 1 isoform X1 [Athalia rosae]
MIKLMRTLTIGKNLIIVLNSGKRYAGHSKWANIKHDKAIKDAKRALNFNKLRRMMSVAIAEGRNANPANNLKLAQIIEHAKKSNMPMSSIKDVLAKAQAVKEATKTGIQEIRGPGGCIVLVEYATDNLVAFKQNLNTLLRKTSCSSADSGAQHLFERKGIVTTEIKGNLGTAVEDAIQVDAEDVVEGTDGDDKEFQFLCEPGLVFKVKQKLLDLNYTVKSSSVQYIPYKMIDLSDSDLELAAALCDKLTAIEDVIVLHDNIA